LYGKSTNILVGLTGCAAGQGTQSQVKDQVTLATEKLDGALTERSSQKSVAPSGVRVIPPTTFSCVPLFFFAASRGILPHVIGNWWNAFQNWYVWEWKGWMALAAIGTVGALGAALIQIGSERRRRHKQEEKDRVERHRAQARLIAAMVGPKEVVAEKIPSCALQGRTAIDLVTGSEEPVYQLVVGIVCIQGTCPEALEKWLQFQQQWNQQDPGSFLSVPVTTVSILPHGTFRIWISGTGWSGVLSGRAGPEIAFTDRAGSHWIRRATGQLEELAKGPFEYFGDLSLNGPYDLLTPERIA
jgi:hypothetical protein